MEMFYPPNHAYFIYKEDTPEELLCEYIYWCHWYLKQKKCFHYYDQPISGEYLINLIIKKLWDDGSLILPKYFTYGRFHDLVRNGRNIEKRVIDKSNWVSNNYERHGDWKCRDEYSGQHYRKLAHHQKKEKNIAREIWRQYKGLYRDKAKLIDPVHKKRTFYKKQQNRHTEDGCHKIYIEKIGMLFIVFKLNMY